MKWTKEQQQAIDERGRNILVAAAAGSGKTAVLVERIKKLIIEDGVPIDRMLIVTFTNAAAAEMKEKIRKALHKEAEEHPENGPKMRQQLALLPRANISTFHAFALDVIRKFFYEADVEPGFSICDDAQRTIMKEGAMDALLEQWFDKDDQDFYDFLGWYSADKNQNKIRAMLDETYGTLMAMPHPWDWLERQVIALSAGKDEFMAGETMERIWSLFGETVEKSIQMEEQAVETLSGNGLDRLAEKVEKEELQQYLEMAETIKNRDWDGLEEQFDRFSSLRLAAKKEEKPDYESVKDLVAAFRKGASSGISALKKSFFLEPLEEQIADMNQTAPKARMLQQLLLDFDHIFRSAKEEKKVIDFNDIEHFCLEILEAGEAAKYYRNKFDHIFIDEYQDTNVLQEEIINLIRRDDNLFMVGDVKQSIYKFRLAEPEIFKAKYSAYQKDVLSMKLDLNKNFRSKSVILSEINEIFDGLMEDYDDDAKLYPGVDYDGEYLYKPEVKVVDAASVDKTDEELANLKNAELEALEVADLIEKNLGRMFFDHKQGVERPLGLRDMVILMRGTKNYADIFYQTLKSHGIDAYVDESDGYFDTIEISVFMNLLSVIDNRQQDVEMISVLHSEIFKFSSAELGHIRAAQKKGSFASALMAYAVGGERPALRKKCAYALESIKAWKAKSLTQPLGDFLWSLMLETGYYLEMGAMPGGAQRQANLRALVDKAEKYMEDRQVSLYSFIRYIDAVKKRKVPMGQVKLIGEQDELVRIMTIHKSKGLEFPMVIVCGMGRKLNYSKVGSGAVLHKDVGVGMTLADYNGHWYKQTLLQKLIASQIHMEEVQEETRILYVALTRAKDFLFMTGTVKDGEKYREFLDQGIIGEGSYLEMIGPANNLKIIDANRLSPGKKPVGGAKRRIEDPGFFAGEASAEQKAEVERRLSYVYPYETARKMKSKYSVSELNQMSHGMMTDAGVKSGAQDSGQSGQPVEPAVTLAVPKFRQGEKKLTAAEKGTIYHGIMERIDFGRVVSEGLAYVEQAVAEMIEKTIFTETEIQAVDLNRIVGFFDSNLGRRAAAAFADHRLERERPFALQMDLHGEPVITQGIIDCYFEEEDGIVLMDYKTNWIDMSRPFEEEAARLRRTYAKQMEIYKDALHTATGKQVKEAYLYLFGAGVAVEV